MEPYHGAPEAVAVPSGTRPWRRWRSSCKPSSLLSSGFGPGPARRHVCHRRRSGPRGGPEGEWLGHGRALRARQVPALDHSAVGTGVAVDPGDDSVCAPVRATRQGHSADLVGEASRHDVKRRLVAECVAREARIGVLACRTGSFRCPCGFMGCFRNACRSPSRTEPRASPV